MPRQSLIFSRLPKHEGSENIYYRTLKALTDAQRVKQSSLNSQKQSDQGMPVCFIHCWGNRCIWLIHKSFNWQHTSHTLRALYSPQTTWLFILRAGHCPQVPSGRVQNLLHWVLCLKGTPATQSLLTKHMLRSVSLTLYKHRKGLGGQGIHCKWPWRQTVLLVQPANFHNSLVCMLPQ